MPKTFVWWPSLAKYRTASMMEPKTQLTEKQWSLIKNLFPQRPVGPAGGRPAIPPRACLGRDPLAAAKRWPLERFTRKISIVCHLLASAA